MDFICAEECTGTVLIIIVIMMIIIVIIIICFIEEHGRWLQHSKIIFLLDSRKLEVAIKLYMLSW